MDDEDQGSLLVRKADSLIEGRQSLTLNEQRLLILAATQLKPDEPIPESGAEVEFRVVDFARHFEIQRDHAYQAASDAAKKLHTRVVTTLVVGKKGYEEEVVNLVQRSRHKKKEGKILVQFTEAAGPYLVKLSKRLNFTTLEVRMLGRLTSAFAFRLYEIASLHRDAEPHEYSLERIRTMFGIEGKYPMWRDLNRVVLEGAMNMVNAETDLHVTIEPLRVMRKFVAVRLKVTTQKAAPRKLAPR